MASILRRGRKVSLKCYLALEMSAPRPSKSLLTLLAPSPKKICKRIASVRSLFDLIVLGNGRVVR